MGVTRGCPIVLLWLACTVFPVRASLYYVYPNSLGPDEAVLNVLPSDYLVFDADKALPTDVVLNYNKEEILDRYKLTENFVGFVFAGNGTVQKVVKSRMGNTGAGNMKRMKTLDAGWQYHELRPLVTNNTIYIEKYFGWVRPAGLRGQVPEEGCLAPCVGDCEEYCGTIPRCLGVLRWVGGSCLVGNAALRLPPLSEDDAPSGYEYTEKKLRHDIFVWIGNWGVALGVTSGVAVLLQVLVPWGLDSSVLNRTVRRLLGLPEGKAVTDYSFVRAFKRIFGRGDPVETGAGAYQF
jgi:hypothetical protein